MLPPEHNNGCALYGEQRARLPYTSHGVVHSNLYATTILSGVPRFTFFHRFASCHFFARHFLAQKNTGYIPVASLLFPC